MRKGETPMTTNNTTPRTPRPAWPNVRGRLPTAAEADIMSGLAILEALEEINEERDRKIPDDLTIPEFLKRK